MKLGYPCINRSVGCTANSTFRLANYSDSFLVEKVENNLSCLGRILRYNLEHDIFFFRISSDIVPFASHPVCTFDWKEHFRSELEDLGRFIKDHDMRISMHPDQFVLINSKKEDVVDRSIAELKWHCEFLDLMGLDDSAKVQIHVGGVYGDKPASMSRFISEYRKLPSLISRRLAIENDDRLYSLKDCVSISEKTGVPIIFDSFHHECLNSGESFSEALALASGTWKQKDGVPMTDYSSQAPGARKGKHVEHIDVSHFREYLEEVREVSDGWDFDVMLEIKDKERSALEALKIFKKIGGVIDG